MKTLQQVTDELIKDATLSGHNMSTFNVYEWSLVSTCQDCRFNVYIDPSTLEAESFLQEKCKFNTLTFDLESETRFVHNGFVFLISAEVDESPDLSYLGTWSDNRESQNSIEHEPYSHYSFNWFNPSDPDYAKEAYKRICNYNNGLWYSVIVCVKMESWKGEGVNESYLGGIESDSSLKYFMEIVQDMIEELAATVA